MTLTAPPHASNTVPSRQGRRALAAAGREAGSDQRCGSSQRAYNAAPSVVPTRYTASRMRERVDGVLGDLAEHAHDEHFVADPEQARRSRVAVSRLAGAGCGGTY